MSNFDMAEPITIYMPLLWEGTSTFMAVGAEQMGNGYRVLGPAPDPDDVIWKYPAGTIVQVRDEELASGTFPVARLALPRAETLHSWSEFSASAEVVFEAFVDPQQVEAWWGAPSSFRTRFRNEQFAGGTWRADFIGADGAASAVFGEYRQWAKSRALVLTYQFSWEPDSAPIEATFEFYDKETGCTVHIEQTGVIREDMRSDGEGGWSLTFGFLRRYLTAT